MIFKDIYYKNNQVLQPDKIPKLLTQYANAENIKKIFRIYHDEYSNSYQDNLFIEVGSGDGYLRYLLSLIDDPINNSFLHNIIETDSSLNTVQGNLSLGGKMIHVGISELIEYFGESFTPCFISMNVMDIFPQEELTSYMQILNKVLRENGVFIHIMSSVTHPNIFKEVKSIYYDKIIFPYYTDGHVGVIIADQNKDLINLLALINPKGELYDLYANNTNEYIKASESVEKFLINNFTSFSKILFKEFFIKKITHAFSKTGFKTVSQGEIYSEKRVKKNQFHDRIPEANCFRNILGSIIADTINNIEIKSDDVIEKSTFYFIIAQKNLDP